jgi:hypothetical protein
MYFEIKQEVKTREPFLQGPIYTLLMSLFANNSCQRGERWKPG